MLHWIEDTTHSLSQDHTDIGDSLSSAELKKQAFSNFQAQIAVSYHLVEAAWAQDIHLEYGYF